MNNEQTRPIALTEQMTALRQVIQKTGAALQSARYEVPPEALEGLSQAEAKSNAWPNSSPAPKRNSATCWR